VESLEVGNLQTNDLLKEKNLLAIYKASRISLAFNRFNFYCTLFVGGILSTYAYSTSEDATLLAGKLQKLSEFGFSFSASILGFLIAGFTIFATVADKDMFINMAKTPYPNSSLSYLKYNFFALMDTFLIYMGFIIICTLIILLGGPSGPISMIFKLVGGELFYPEVKRFSLGVALAVLGTYFFYLIMVLQSFIFNIYHIVMTGIAWEDQAKMNEIQQAQAEVKRLTVKLQELGIDPEA
jgi:hypothetical protein